MHYFVDRKQAGKLLADKLTAYMSENCAVIALSEGGIIIGLEIARRIQSSMFVLATENITHRASSRNLIANYEDNNLPEHKTAMDMMKNIVLSW